MATHVAASASRADVLTAYGLCSAGDKLVVPAGSESWTSEIEITIPITIDGTGATLTAGATMTNGFFHLTGIDSTTLMRITGFVFNNVDTAGGFTIRFTNLNLTNLRIDHNTLNKGYTMLDVVGCKGVIDHNDIYNAHTVFTFSAGTRAQQDASWVSMAAGTSDALFIEDNNIYFDANWTSGTGNDTVLDTYGGGKLVFRYNTIDSTNLAAGFTDQLWLLMCHGNAAGGAASGYWQYDADARRGQSVIEIYNNTCTGKQFAKLFYQRGSACLVHDNVCNSSTYATGCYLREEEPDGGQWTPARTVWPAEDQVHNTFYWDNIFNTVPQIDDNIEVASGSETFIQKDRDFFTHRPATTGEGMTLGKETFTGLNGGTNTAPTDGITYPTLGSMAFTPAVENAYYGYTPYVYPHPLTSGSPWVLVY